VTIWRIAKTMRDTRIVRGRHTPEKTELARQARKEPTPTEKRLWAFLRAGRLGGLHFRQQQVIGGFIADFYCHAAKLAIEVMAQFTTIGRNTTRSATGSFKLREFASFALQQLT
jgi:very-short-patch-repair endonuclease